jgi:uncharacterized protein (TIGR02145 family)
LTYGTLTDQDGNIYKTIKIGSQIWMAENLRTTKYRNGNLVTNIKDNGKWRTTTDGAYCNYNNTYDLDTIATFGRLYNWYAVSDNRSIAPEGWHIPTDAEWTILITNLSDGNDAAGDTIVGAYLKEAGDAHWRSNSELGNPIADNRSGFTALPCGWHAGDGFGQTWAGTTFWSSTEYSDTQVWIRSLISGFSFVLRGNYGYKSLGFPIRCVKD